MGQKKIEKESPVADHKLEAKVEIDIKEESTSYEEDNEGNIYSDPDDPKEDLEEIKIEEIEEIEVNEDSPFACDECDVVVKTKAAFIAHQYKHTGETRLVCKYCDFKTNYPQNMYTHKLSKHADVAAFSCHSCSFKTLMEKKLNKHATDYPNGTCKEEEIKKKLMKMIKAENAEKATQKPRRDKLFSCTVCDYVINDKRLLTSHMAKHTGAKMFSCKECNFESNHRASIHNHIKEVHTADMKYTCDVCMFKSNLKYKWRKHEKDKAKGVCQSIWNTDSVANNVKKQASSVLHACKHCDKNIPSGKVPQHYKENHPKEEKPYSCEECLYGCYWKLNLRKHVEAVHRGITHQCHVCTFNTKWYVALNQHLRITHNIRKRKPNEENPLKEGKEPRPRTENLCDLCGYKTLYGSNMKSHQRSVHKIGLKKGETEAKPKVMRICDLCEYKTVYNSNMISHRRSKHKIGLKEGEMESKPKVMRFCDFCDYKTIYSSNMCSHKRNVHKGLVVNTDEHSVFGSLPDIFY